MKILLLADARAVHTVRFKKGLKDAGAEVFLASLEPGVEADYSIKKRGAFNSLNYFAAGGQIRNLIKSFSPDIINPHFASGYGFAVAVGRIGKKTPVVLHCLGSDILISPRKSFLHKWRVSKALSDATKVIVDSQYLSNEVQKLNSGIEPAIIPWGVEEGVLQIFLKKENSTIDNRRPLRILVPRPHNRVYNNNFIIDALAELIKERKVSLTFPAWGDDYESFRGKCGRLFPEGGINFYNFLPRRDYIKFLAGFDVYLSAALSDSSPVSLIEAMGAGLFPVVGNISGIREWANEENSILFDLHDAGALRTGLNRLFSGDFNYKGILLRNHRRVRNEALFSDNIRRTLNIMEGLVGGKK